MFKVLSSTIGQFSTTSFCGECLIMLVFFSCLQNFHEQVMQKADIIQATGDAIVTIPDVACLTPRYLLFTIHTWLWTCQGLSTGLIQTQVLEKCLWYFIFPSWLLCFVSLPPLKMHQKKILGINVKPKTSADSTKVLNFLLATSLFASSICYCKQNKSISWCRDSLHMSQVAHQAGVYILVSVAWSD